MQEEWLAMCEAEKKNNVSTDYGEDMLNARSRNREMPSSSSSDDD